MSFSFPNRPSRHGRHMSNTPSPLRYAFTADLPEDATAHDDPFVAPTKAHSPLGPLRSSTMNRRASGDRPHSAQSHKRGISETSPTRKENQDYHYDGHRTSSSRTSSEHRPQKSLADTPTPSLQPDPSPPRVHFSQQSSALPDQSPSLGRSNSRAKQDYSVGIGRSDSRRAPAHGHTSRRSALDGSAAQQAAILDASELKELGHSSTSQLRDLSRMTEQDEEGFIIKSPEQEVAGLHGRRRLQISNGEKKTRMPGYGGRTWIDQQRQFLQAYEYLCHIGEAKDWIEDVIGKPIPPIVQLEEALRDGVTLAEVVQTLEPRKKYRIFRSERLQFRHSDNIAIFFRYLAEVELPDLFRFELVDLYEKKNIPKVIYCIHALSWLLLKKGIVDFRIGNLVGQLQFEDHELEATQKGLDKAGVSMPNFSGMSDKFGAEPEPEPVETEEQRIERELQEQEAAVIDLQAQLRGAILRLSLGNKMEQFWDCENAVVDLQSRLRGFVSRERSNYHIQMRRFAVGLQCHAKGFLVRDRARQRDHDWNTNSEYVLKIQSLFRGRKARQEVLQVRSEAMRYDKPIRMLQAHLRGASIRRKQLAQEAEWHGNEKSIVILQRLIRGRKVRQDTQNIKSYMQMHTGSIRDLQALARATLLRKRESQLEKKIILETGPVILFQSMFRGVRARQNVADTQEDLHLSTASITELQSAVRGFLQRNECTRILGSVGSDEVQIAMLQSLSRGMQARNRVQTLRSKLNAHSKVIAQLQSQARGACARNDVGLVIEDLQAEEEQLVDLQASLRAFTTRRKFTEKKKYYEENVKKVIKAQSYIRARQQGEAYKTLTKGKDPPANTIKNFAHLLNDSDFDFEEEVEIKKLRENVRHLIASNDQTEQYITELDTKIGLLARNKIERDEVAKLQKHIGSTVMMRRGGSTRDAFNVKSLNKDARAKLDMYEELLFTLQTQPVYLSRLFLTLSTNGASEMEYKRMEGLVMSMFGMCQQRREEYYLLKLIVMAMHKEHELLPSQDLLRGSHFYLRLLSRYARSHSDKKFLRNMISKFVNEVVVSNPQLDLESDPLKIYRAAINNEQLRTGQRSDRPIDVAAEVAIKDPETRRIFIQHLQDLRDVLDAFMILAEESLPKMPFGVRYVAQQMFLTLRESLPPGEDDYFLMQTLGNWIWKWYFRPAFEETEIALEQDLSQTQRNNKHILVEVMGQIISGRPFDKQPFLQPLSNYVETEAMPRMGSFWAAMIDVPSSEVQFDMDPSQDAHAMHKPSLSIKMSDMFEIHERVANEATSICCEPQDNALHAVIKELGSAKANKAAMGSSSGEITLALGSKSHLMEDPDAEMKSLFMETKRCVLYIVRVQQGSSLMDILVKPITEEDEEAWSALVNEELAAGGGERAAYSECAQKFDDIASMSYRQLKAVALQNIVVLEQRGRLSRNNYYQDLLNDIAVDIRHRNRRRVQRRRELEAVRATESSLREKAAYLEDKLKTYNDTFEQNLNVLQKQRRKKQFLMPFSKQYNHQKELERLGRMPRYGSFKYSAQTLWEKGIMISWGQHRDCDVTISSDQVNSFSIEGSVGSMMLPGASATFTWDDLLEAQYEGKKDLRFFNGADTLVVDREAFIAQVSKKFWVDG